MDVNSWSWTYVHHCFFAAHQAKLVLCVPQVLGLFTTVATATGCLYFLDQDSIAVSGKGLYAAGVLLLILNLFFVVLMAALIAREGAPHLKQWAVWSKSHASGLSRSMQNIRLNMKLNSKLWRWKSSRGQPGLELSSNNSLSSNQGLSRRGSAQMTLLSHASTGSANPSTNAASRHSGCLYTMCCSNQVSQASMYIRCLSQNCTRIHLKSHMWTRVKFGSKAVLCAILHIFKRKMCKKAQ